MRRLCEYRDVFGAPNTGVHKYKIGGIAIVDFALTILLIVIIVLYFKTSPLWTTVGVFAVAEILHYLFCIRNPIVV